jgi:hypothetical protein
MTPRWIVHPGTGTTPAILELDLVGGGTERVFGSVCRSND